MPACTRSPSRTTPSAWKSGRSSAARCRRSSTRRTSSSCCSTTPPSCPPTRSTTRPTTRRGTPAGTSASPRSSPGKYVAPPVRGHHRPRPRRAVGPADDGGADEGRHHDRVARPALRLPADAQAVPRRARRRRGVHAGEPGAVRLPLRLGAAPDPDDRRSRRRSSSRAGARHVVPLQPRRAARCRSTSRSSWPTLAGRTGPRRSPPSLPASATWKVFSQRPDRFAARRSATRRGSARCAIEYASESGIAAYWGLWINTGGWGGHQHFAIEPTTGRFDQIDRAMRDGSAGQIGPLGTGRLVHPMVFAGRRFKARPRSTSIAIFITAKRLTFWRSARSIIA